MKATTTAEQLIAAVEASELGSDITAEVSKAAAAITELDASGARAQIFPASIAPITADAIEAHRWFTAGFHPDRHAEQMADLHRRSLEGWPEFAALLRSQDVITKVGAAAATMAHTRARKPAEVDAEARRTYEIAVARQLVQVHHELAPMAERLLAADDLAHRLAAVKAKHAAHAVHVAEVERQAGMTETAREAERRREEQRRQAEEDEERRRNVKAEAIAARVANGHRIADKLKESGLTHLRVGRDLYSVAGLSRSLPECSERRQTYFEDALAAELARRQSA